MSEISVLVANRGEVAVRVIRAAADLGMRSVAVYSADDASSLHRRRADDAVRLPGSGPAAYLDAAAYVATAGETGCTLLHPGWGFLSEQPDLARRCAAAGVRFVGPTPDTLQTLGDKVSARRLATDLGVPVLESTGDAADLEQVRALLHRAPASGGVMLKALAGGGGRGIRAVTSEDRLASAYKTCVAEATTAFGDGRVFAEMYLPHCRHVEVQVLGDGTGAVAVLGDRDCSVQRSWQKLIEIAPAPGLTAEVRAALAAAARTMAEQQRYRGVGTFEFLLDVADGSWYFMEANPRLQVEHTITEEVFGVDLVAAQLRVAAGSTLRELGLDVDREPVGSAVQIRVNAERIVGESALPSPGHVERLRLPIGPGIRVDTGIAEGDVVSPRFDSLLAKVIAHDRGGLAAAVGRVRAALEDLQVAGVDTNLELLCALLEDPRVASGELSTDMVAGHTERLAAAAQPTGPAANEPERVGRAGSIDVRALASGMVVGVDVAVGQVVAAGDDLVRVEAMKMQHVSVAPRRGRVEEVTAEVGRDCRAGEILVRIEPNAAEPETIHGRRPVTGDADQPRPELEHLWARRALLADDARPRAVESRRAARGRTVRENVADLFEPGTFTEYGGLAIAGRLWRDSEAELTQRTPADGVVTGIGHLGAAAPEERSAGHTDSTATQRCAVIAYDPTVMAGTQGQVGSQKVERLLDIVERSMLPLVLFADGGGGRPGDDAPGTSAPPLELFRTFGRLSGRVPLVGTVAGPCFGGNAALLACCDVVVATRGANIGMAGPVVVEAGGLGRYAVSDIGPAETLGGAGLVDVLVDDERTAVTVVKQVLSYFGGGPRPWTAGDQLALRTALPRERLRAYDVNEVIALLADRDSVLTLGSTFGKTMSTALVRLEGRAVGVVANNPSHGAGAIDHDGATKAARFARLCDRFGVPLLFLCDTPGFAVGPDAEASGQLGPFSELILAGARLDVPFATIVLRKAYGLGAVAMCGGSFRAPIGVAAWPGAEFGGMAPEASVRLSSAADLRAIDDPGEREAEFRRRVEKAREATDAIRAAHRFRVDDVLDPAISRSWVCSLLFPS